MRPKPLLRALFARGKPLAEVVVGLAEGADPAEVAEILDTLAPDLAAAVRSAYFQPAGLERPILQVHMDATREALEREFGWRIRRIHAPRWVESLRRYDGVHPDCFLWEAQNSPERFPDVLGGRVVSLGLTQPGVADQGQADTVEYSLEP